MIAQREDNADYVGGFLLGKEKAEAAGFGDDIFVMRNFDGVWFVGKVVEKRMFRAKGRFVKVLYEDGDWHWVGLSQLWGMYSVAERASAATGQRVGTPFGQ